VVSRTPAEIIGWWWSRMTSSWAGRAQRSSGTGTRYPRAGGRREEGGGRRRRDDGMMREKGKGRRDPWQAGGGSRRSAQHGEHSKALHSTAEHTPQSTAPQSTAPHQRSAYHLLVATASLGLWRRAAWVGGFSTAHRARGDAYIRPVLRGTDTGVGRATGGRNSNGRSWPYYSMRAPAMPRGVA
jgi:hypothetical protein